jgi:hypothetical protein
VADPAREHYERALSLGRQCRWRLAKKESLAAVKGDPSNLLARALLIQARAETGEMTLKEAETEVRELSAIHPDIWRLRVNVAMLAGRQARNEEALSKLLELLSEHGEDSRLHQGIGGIYAVLKRWPESWGHYRIALASGDLISLRDQYTAYEAAVKAGDGSEARRLALGRLNPFKRLAFVTRARAMPLYWIPLALAALASILYSASGRHPLSFLFMGMATAIALWIIFSLIYVCRAPRCVLFAFLLLIPLWGLYLAFAIFANLYWLWALAIIVLFKTRWGAILRRLGLARKAPGTPADRSTASGS